MTASITLLKEAKKELSTANRSLKQWKESSSFGQEGEYTSNSLKAGIDAILTDLSALLKSDAKLIKETTLQERQGLSSAITKLTGAITARNGSHISVHLDSLKLLLRPYNLRASTERKEEFLEHCDELQRKATELSIKTKEIESLFSNIESITEETNNKSQLLQARISELEKAIESIPEQLAEISEKDESADDLISSISNTETSSKEILAQIKDAGSIIENFAKKISQREIELEKQTEKTTLYEEHLSNYQKQHEKLIQKAESLIEQSRQALEYATAED